MLVTVGQLGVAGSPQVDPPPRDEFPKSGRCEEVRKGVVDPEEDFPALADPVVESTDPVGS
jgi:hypothetical protein